MKYDPDPWPNIPLRYRLIVLASKAGGLQRRLASLRADLAAYVALLEDTAREVADATEPAQDTAHECAESHR